jgi:hypothetical protein
MCSKVSSDSPLTPGPDNLTLVPPVVDEEVVENLPEQYTDICAAESGRRSVPVDISAKSSLVIEFGIAMYRASFNEEGRAVVTCFMIAVSSSLFSPDTQNGVSWPRSARSGTAHPSVRSQIVGSTE